MKARILVLCLLPLTAVLGQEAAQPDYTGVWHLTSDTNTQLLMEQKAGTIHVKELKGAETLADYQCNTLGKECKVKEQGHTAMVSYWFNGPKLVELKTRGSNVVRRRFELGDSGQTLKVELNSLVPSGSSENLIFARDKH